MRKRIEPAAISGTPRSLEKDDMCIEDVTDVRG
jgi:hypothetical protein